jgi:predicted ATPase
LNHPYTLAAALAIGGHVHQFVGDPRETREWAEASVALGSEHNFVFWTSYGMILRGWALVEQGCAGEGMMDIRQGLAAFRAAGAECMRPNFLSLLAEAHAKVGQYDEGLGVLAQAQEALRETGEPWWEAELCRLKGELTLKRPRAESSAIENEKEAGRCFCKALSIAARQGAKPLQLRAAMSLGRLWKSQGKSAQAWQMLAEIYGWFTEGFDTVDLKEARALLEELGD